MDCFKKWQPYMATRLFDFEKELLALPPVTPAEKQESGENPHIYECPCGYGWDKSKVVRHHFCPNCGRAVNSTEQEPCDAVSRKEVMNMLHNHAFDYATSTKILALLKTMCGEVDRMPSVTPQYTDAEIQKMQELEQAEIQKAYEIGKAENIEVLDKIRDEIVHLHDWAFSREEILRIIDKYKVSPTGAESEDKK